MGLGMHWVGQVGPRGAGLGRGRVGRAECGVGHALGGVGH